ncbi:hypothetical protein AX774_g4287 [Zancudomyces culisetae]|uniref:Uncharacterized protein n=1 Tax=Zancudomyces culisetae TaxID=1213189 RepID=A0A1R1PMQ6_ZANCU|nr:hypothetical protein AX774_g4287 [Zancudomyces culisetae]|eukprot:OMH82246.1 hypothetical protein AX774_g4287 [Zancudomyces culisetae]
MFNRDEVYDILMQLTANVGRRVLEKSEVTASSHGDNMVLGVVEEDSNSGTKERAPDSERGERMDRQTTSVKGITSRGRGVDRNASEC